MKQTHNLPLFETWLLRARAALRYDKRWLHEDAAVVRKLVEDYGNYLYPHMREIPGDYEVIIQALFLQVLLEGRWAMSGFPVITIGHKDMALFMSTTIRPEEAEKYVRAPWPAFCIRLPTPFITIEDGEGIHQDAVMCLVTQFAGNWYYKYTSEATGKNALGISIWGFQVESSMMAGEAFSEHARKWVTVDKTDKDIRQERLMQKLIMSVCLACTGNPESDFTKTGRKSKPRSIKLEGRDMELPDYQTFDIRLDIKKKVDVLPVVREFIERGGSSPKVQTLVAGHWKQQAYGKGHKLHKSLFITPYFRGPMDAPLVVHAGKEAKEVIG